ncbi:SDR family NAD(P)-dependent oxidoreductase [Nocardioides alkalitolerans]|uniref:SDR family NAD(P)-dependent oxidoreductase n=1 Tax=Nocardioides alkalitolerans TaxID=281714 RepID=UPI00040D4693|nr:SDR family NAD(P)-dependent oxidoreductase [Nocardioides alkalitolerans]
MKELDGRVAVITGAASGIGRALADECAARGMRVVVADVDGARIEEVATELRSRGAQVVGVPTDVTDPAQVERLADRTSSEFGDPQLLCLNAGVAAGGVAWELDERAWRWVIDVNLWGLIHGVRAFLPRMVDEEEGHVLVTASIGGLIGSPGMGAYSASKHAAIGLAESLREDLRLAGSAVGVTVLCPGFTRTRMNDSARSWPDALGAPPDGGLAPGHPRLREAFLARMTDAAEPVDVAAAALQAVQAREFWAVTDREIGPRLAAHLAPVLHGPPCPEGAEPW